MPDPTFALIVPLGGSFPGFGHPSHPIQPPLPGAPDQGLPEPPAWPGHHPSHPIALPPPGFWPLPPGPDQGLPPLPPGAPDQSLPVAPGVPIYPAHPIVPPGGDPSHPIALPPGMVWPPLPPQLGHGLVLALVVVYGIGYRWVVIDLDAQPTPPIAATPAPK